MLIAAVVLLVLALLLACPVRVSAVYEQELALTVGYLFLRFRILPEREEKKPREEKKKPKKEPAPQESGEKTNFRDILKQRGIRGLLRILTEAASLAASVLKSFCSHVRVTQFDLFLLIATEDAAETATRYGKVCAAAYPAAGALMQACGCRNFGVSVVPDFQRSKSEARFRFRARVSLFFIIKEGVSALVRAAKLWKKFQETPAGEKGQTKPSNAKSN